MAHLNITLNQEEILQLLSEDRDAVFRTLLHNSLNSILKAESAAQLKAEPYEHSEERTDGRNGFRERDYKTRIGKITLAVPRHRNQPFETPLFENNARIEAALIASMAEMVVNGVSKRKVSRIIETICGTTISKSAVSEACRGLSKEVERFRNRPINGNYPFLTVEATYFKVRENDRVISKALITAYASNSQGIREVIGFGAYPRGSKNTWTELLTSLKKPGPCGILKITSDAHEGLIQSIGKVFPDVPWKRCQFHFSRNISDKVPKKYQFGLRAELQEMFNCKTLKECCRRKDEIMSEYRDIAEAAMNCLYEGFESAMTVMSLPTGMQRFFRTSNHIERLNKELKRCSKVIGIFPNEESMTRLMGSVLIEQNSICQTRKAIFSKKSYQRLLQSDVRENLHRIAEEQGNLLAA